MIRQGFLDLRTISEAEYRALLLQQLSALILAVERLREKVDALVPDGFRPADAGDTDADAPRDGREDAELVAPPSAIGDELASSPSAPRLVLPPGAA